MPIEEKVRLATIDLIGNRGTVYVERSGVGIRDSVLVNVSIDGTTSNDEARRLMQKLAVLLEEFLPDCAAPSCCLQTEYHREVFYLTSVRDAGKVYLSAQESMARHQ